MSTKSSSGDTARAIAVLAVIGFFVYWHFAPSTPAPVHVKTPQEIAEDASKKAAGLGCLSAWDGSYRPLVEALKPTLRDPDSFEHVSTRITPVNDKGINSVIMEYRAKNGFGGKNAGIATADLRNSDCGMTTWVNLVDQ
jgi:hypothetical protein